ncbi:MAG: hypothetical protein ACFE7E_01430 [Candidatus Hodarchaeota archaeon]
MGMGKEPRIIIEHLEKVVGRWIWLEYRHVSRLVGRENLLITNIKKRRDAIKFAEIASIANLSITRLPFDRSKLIILDPRADIVLDPQDLKGDKWIILGGILGDHPPIGRTELLLSKRMKDIPYRHIGKHQFSIDGAVYIVLQIAKGKGIESIPITLKPEITITDNYSVTLPFAFPQVDGKPLFAPGLIGYLKKGIVKDEKEIIMTGRPVSIT